jgi:NAD(P)-dependent dehydrogenase (short-subunit alcohol dehydrogenase family)
MDFTGAGFVVTGAGSGIGKSCVNKLLDNGAMVAGFDLIPPQIASPRFRGFALDVRDEEGVGRCIQAARSDFGTIRGLVNAAGIFAASRPFYELSVEEWDKVISTNLAGVFFCAKYAARAMIGEGRGKIVNIGCIRSRVVRPNMAEYAASKGGVAALTAAMAVDLAAFNIQVNSVAPGFTMTGMTEKIFADPDVRRTREQQVPMGRIAHPDDIAGAVLFLLSPASDYVTGQTIFVDGGFTASK